MSEQCSFGERWIKRGSRWEERIICADFGFSCAAHTICDEGD